MHRVRLLLSMDGKRRWTFTVTVTVLLYGFFLNDILCESLCTDETKQLLIVNVTNTDPKGSEFPSTPHCSDVCPVASGINLCTRVGKENQAVNIDCCHAGNSNDILEIRKHGQRYSLTLNEETLSHRDIVLLYSQADEWSCVPFVLYDKTSDFLLNIDNCTTKGMTNIRITQNDFVELCTEYSHYHEHACKGKDSTKFILTVSSGGQKGCVSCKPPVNIILPPLDGSTGTISAEKAAELMGNLSSLLEQMGTATTAALSVGGIKGLINKIPPKNQTNIIFSFSSVGGDMSIVDNETVLETAFSRSVHVSEEASVRALHRNGSFVGVLFFPGLSQDEKKSIIFNNEVLGIDMGVKISNLSNTIDIHYRNVDKRGAKVFCNSWDGKGKRPTWTTEGCHTRESNDSFTCQCTHLTFFAVLMSPPTGNISSSDMTSLTYVTSVGCGLSMFFLALALFMQCLIRKGKSSQATKILTNLFIAMFVLNLTFLINESVASLGNFGACVAIAAVMHYTMLATFTWFSLEALHLYLQLRNVPAEINHYMMKICITGWVTPALVVTSIVAVGKYDYMVINTDDGNSVTMCWISDVSVHQGVNVGYYATVFIFTFSVFVMVMRVFLLRAKAGDAQDTSAIKTNSFSILSLLLLLGITWAFAFFSHGPLAVASYYIFTILNSLQGFFLFFYYYNISKTVGVDRGSTVSNTGINAVN